MIKNIMYGTLCFLFVVLAFCAISISMHFSSPKAHVTVGYVTYDVDVDNTAEAVDLFYTLKNQHIERRK